MSLRSRFDERVMPGDPDECWPWTGTINRKGYGQISDGRGVTLLAHRIAFEQANGEIPEGSQVCHTCDNPPCCNPAHLYAGTAAQNQHDKRDRGRAAKGERNGGGGKLSEDDVRSIRADLAAGDTLRAIAARFGVSPPMISYIRDGKQWSHVR